MNPFASSDWGWTEPPPAPTYSEDWKNLVRGQGFWICKPDGTTQGPVMEFRGYKWVNGLIAQGFQEVVCASLPHFKRLWDCDGDHAIFSRVVAFMEHRRGFHIIDDLIVTVRLDFDFNMTSEERRVVVTWCRKRLGGMIKSWRPL